MLALRLPADVENRLAALAKAPGRSKKNWPARPYLSIWTNFRIYIFRSNVWPTSVRGRPGPFPLRMS